MAAEYKDYYKILGVPKTAGKEEISKAFKKLARQYHPDLNQGDPKAEERFKEINEANEVLSDPEKRRMYDQLGPDWQNGARFGGGPGGFNFNFNGQDFGGGDFSDFFRAAFGGQAGSFGGRDPFGGFGRQRRGRDEECPVSVTLEESVKGCTKTLSVGGKTLSVSIPAGVKENGKLRLAGKGGEGTPNGDLYVIVRYEPHPHFKVDGLNITSDVTILPWEALFGTRTRVDTLEGEVEIGIPAGTGSGRKLRLRGKGLGPKGSRGDQFVQVQIRVPDPSSLSEDELKHWKALAGNT